MSCTYTKLVFIVSISLLTCHVVRAGDSFTNEPSPLMWSTNETVPEDIHVAFRGSFTVSTAIHAKLLVSGASWYVIWLDGKYFYEGPDRYNAAFPEYQVKDLALTAGNHLLAVQVHYEGTETRILKNIQPFLLCKIETEHAYIPVEWKCLQLAGYESKLKRINAELGWVEWVDTRKNPREWQQQHFIDSGWKPVVAVERSIGAFSASAISNVKNTEYSPRLMEEGKLAEVYGYEKDNISARFFLRDLSCINLPPQGVWRRYDLGKVMLARPKFVLDLPAGAVVEFAYCEQLMHNRVSPWISLSLSDSYNLDHFVAAGGVQEFFPLTPRGGRYMEIHILAAPESIKWISEKIIDRSYYDHPEGSFICNDSLLNRIWQVGIDTYTSCAEDALIDNPTRERGQWTGDVGTVGMRIGSAGFSDIKICRRGLVQAAQSARTDGMVAGLCPGGEAYLSSYAAQWVNGCLEYWRLTGDKSLLAALFPAAEKNAGAFKKYLTADGIGNEAGWAFIDWGYVSNRGSSDMGLNLHCYMAFLGMEKWASQLGKKDKAAGYKQLAQQLATIITAYFAAAHVGTGFNWDTIGYHRTVLGMMAGFVPRSNYPEAIAFIKKHILNCFPNKAAAPRLSDPGANNPQLITPYFAHYAFPILIENGEMDFVLDQYRKCWGWALEEGRTTWTEVFDTRWTHCHQWSGCPSWQLTRYVLGLKPAFDIAVNMFELNLQTGSLLHAEGFVTLPDGKKCFVKWEKKMGKLYYELSTPEPIVISIPPGQGKNKSKQIKVSDKIALVI